MRTSVYILFLGDPSIGPLDPFSLVLPPRLVCLVHLVCCVAATQHSHAVPDVEGHEVAVNDEDADGSGSAVLATALADFLY